MPTLNIYLQVGKVGVLFSDDGRLSFCYDQEYFALTNPESFSF